MLIKVHAKIGDLGREKADGVLIPLFEDHGELCGSFPQLDKATADLLCLLVKRGDFRGERYKTFMVYTHDPVAPRRIILVGLGKRDEFDLDRMREAGGAGFYYAREAGLKKLIVPAKSVEVDGFSIEELLEAFLTGGILRTYQFNELKTNDKPSRAMLNECVVMSGDRVQRESIKQALRRATIVSQAVYLARDLVSLPANKKTPTILAGIARSIAKRQGLKCKIISEKEARTMGMGAFSAVGQGSREPATMIILEYRAGCNYGRPIVLIGKGITFDSGGISLKPPDRMEVMKDDMAGGAAVMAILQATAELQLPLHVIGIIPAAENLPGGKAYKPGDVLVSLSGQTIEVISTDAEGRLILADALTYAQRFRPQAIVDLATLTGACVVALGDYVAGVMGNNESHLTRVKIAGEKSGEKVWPLPLWEEYFEYLRSDVADFKNVGGRAAGTITAGMFLKRFVGSAPWVHIDIAGPAWLEKDRPYMPKGASGFGVRLLMQLLMEWQQ